MLSDYFGCLTFPDAIAKASGNYTQQGLIVWPNLKFEKMAFQRREYGRNDKEIRLALKDPNRAVILQVNDGQHWVVAIRSNFFGGGYTVLDPWTGKKCNVLKVYRNITGAAYFSRK